MSESKDSKSEWQRPGPDLADESTSPEELSLAAINRNIEKKLEEAEISLPPEERRRVGMVVEQIIEKSQFFPDRSHRRSYSRNMSVFAQDGQKSSCKWA